MRPARERWTVWNGDRMLVTDVTRERARELVHGLIEQGQRDAYAESGDGETYRPPGTAAHEPGT